MQNQEIPDGRREERALEVEVQGANEQRREELRKANLFLDRPAEARGAASAAASDRARFIRVSSGEAPPADDRTPFLWAELDGRCYARPHPPVRTSGGAYRNRRLGPGADTAGKG